MKTFQLRLDDSVRCKMQWRSFPGEDVIEEAKNTLRNMYSILADTFGYSLITVRDGNKTSFKVQAGAYEAVYHLEEV